MSTCKVQAKITADSKCANGFTLDKSVYEFSKLEQQNNDPDVINCETDDQKEDNYLGQYFLIKVHEVTSSP